MRSLLFLLSLTTTTNGQASSSRIAVLDNVKTAAGLENVHGDLRQAISRAAQGRGVLIATPVSASCSDEPCVTKAAQEVGADLVVSLEGAYGANDYVVDVRLFHAGTGTWTTRDARRDFCIAGCKLELLFTRVEIFVRELMDSAPAVSRRPPEVSIPSQSPKASIGVPTIAAPPVVESSTSWAPYSLMVGGLALTATGAILWSLDGNTTGTCSPATSVQEKKCDVRNTKTFGEVTTAVGLVGVVAGTAWLISRSIGPKRADFSLLLGPGTVSMGGTF